MAAASSSAVTCFGRQLAQLAHHQLDDVVGVPLRANPRYRPSAERTLPVERDQPCR